MSLLHPCCSNIISHIPSWNFHHPFLPSSSPQPWFSTISLTSAWTWSLHLLFWSCYLWYFLFSSFSDSCFPSLDASSVRTCPEKLFSSRCFIRNRRGSCHLIIISLLFIYLFMFFWLQGYLFNLVFASVDIDLHAAHGLWICQEKSISGYSRKEEAAAPGGGKESSWARLPRCSCSLRRCIKCRWLQAIHWGCHQPLWPP